jgi:hypothetical protein
MGFVLADFGRRASFSPVRQNSGFLSRFMGQIPMMDNILYFIDE